MSEDVQETALVPQKAGIVMPAVSPQEAVKAWQAYQDMKVAILDPEHDIQRIGKQEFKKKSYWRKVTTFFNLTVNTLEERKEVDPQDTSNLTYHFTLEAVAPNGRRMPGVGSCSTYEKATWRDGQWMSYNSYKNQWTVAQPNSEHNVRSTAFTRAENRAVSDLVGGGEVSAEEINQRDFEQDEPTSAKPSPRATAKPSQRSEPEVVQHNGRAIETATGEVLEADPFEVAADDTAPSDNEISALYELAEEKGHDEAKIEGMIKAKFKVSPDMLSRKQYTAVMDGLATQVSK